MLAIIFATTGAIGAGVVLASVILAAGRHTAAQRALRQEMLRHRDQSMELEKIKAILELDSLDPKQLTTARSIIAVLAETLSKRKRSDILRTLDQGSDKSRANYIIKLVEDYEAHAS